MSLETVSTKLERIAKQSEQNPEMVFTTLAHQMDVEFLLEAFGRLRKNAAMGVDKVSVKKYARNLDENLRGLHERLKTGSYRAQPARRVYISKEDGTDRALAILALEDKIVQKAVAMLLGAVYESVFYDFSYGFLQKRSAHQALKYLREQCVELNINWIVDADVRGFFDNVDRGHLRTILKRRVNDGAITRLLGKWFHAGVLEDEGLVISEKGVQQGGVISPVLSNIFLHTVLDDWFEREVRPRMKGRCFIVRFADDCVPRRRRKEAEVVN